MRKGVAYSRIHCWWEKKINFSLRERRKRQNIPQIINEKNSPHVLKYLIYKMTKEIKCLHKPQFWISSTGSTSMSLIHSFVSRCWIWHKIAFANVQVHWHPLKTHESSSECKCKQNFEKRRSAIHPIVASLVPVNKGYFLSNGESRLRNGSNKWNNNQNPIFCAGFDAKQQLLSSPPRCFQNQS